MNVSNATASAPLKPTATIEAKENPAVPDHDNDGDDAPAAIATKAPPAPGTGTTVDKSA